jgi:UDP-N-acetylmuramoylalanine--D-glutamate ligase
VLVVGLCARGRAACALLRRQGARVTAIDRADTAPLRTAGAALKEAGVEVLLNRSVPPAGSYDLAVASPAVALAAGPLGELRARGVPVVGELELGYQYARCLTLAVAGTNGKSITAALIQRALEQCHRPAVVAGNRALPACAAAEQTRDLDFLILQANALQLEGTQMFRPAVAVLLNLEHDQLDRFPTPEGYAAAHARLFRNQQMFDWAVIQSEALRRLQAFGIPVPARTITFSADDPAADLHLDRGLLISRLPEWAGPLLSLETCRLQGPHNAENLMAALAVGRILRLPLEEMAAAFRDFSAGPHRFELVAETGGVQFINDSKATNAHALRQALVGTRRIAGGGPNVWLIAGGLSHAPDFHDLGPLLSQRVKRVFLIGESTEKLRAAWGLFTPCTVSQTLLEAVSEAAKNASPDDVVLLSPACSSFDQFRDYQERGETFCRAVKSISGGLPDSHPYRMVSL